MAFRTIPEGVSALRNVTLPACLVGGKGDLVRADLALSDGVIVHIDQTSGSASERSGETATGAPDPSTSTSGAGDQAVDMAGALVLPAFVDMHTHLDKGHIWDRAPNPDGTFAGALATVAADRTAHWSAEDVRARMRFGLAAAYAHGTRAIRTHLDAIPPQDAISFPVFCELRAEWASRIHLQAACLIGVDKMDPDGAFAATAARVAEAEGSLGMVTYPVPDLQAKLDAFFALAETHGLDVDLHVDETLDPAVETLRVIAETVRARRFAGRVVVGHCCALSAQDEARALDTLDLVAQAGLHVVSLPMCNLYLQDRHAARTPRLRGITLVHEMVARDIPVSFASDNTRDPFYAYGDLDMLEVLRQATRIGHLDHSRPDWIRSVITRPADAMGIAPQDLSPGARADLVIFNARGWTELFARPHSDRIVLRGGRQIDAAPPDYRELDHLMRTA